MRTADLKTDGTVYYVVVRFGRTRDDGDRYGGIRAELLDLRAPDAPQGWRHEKRPIKARLLESYGDTAGMQKGDIVFLSPRLVLCTEERRKEAVREAEAAQVERERKRAAGVARLRPQVEEATRLQHELGLVTRSYTGEVRPLIEVTLDERYGSSRMRLNGADPEALLAMLRKLRREEETC